VNAIFAIFLAILLVLVVQQLRAGLALPFPRRRYSVLTAQPVEDLDTLFAEFHQQVSTIGFAGPVWLRSERVDGESEAMPLAAAYRAPDGLGLLRVAPPISLQHPHRMATYFSHRLEDGRTAISQPFDAYFALLQGGDLVARTVSEPDISGQWQAHHDWVGSLGSGPIAILDSDLSEYTSSFFEGMRQRLIAKGAIRAVTPDLALPRITLALRMIHALRTLPKPPADIRPVPPARLARLANVHELINQRVPPRDVQLLLFTFSIALFVGLGALFWGMALAVSILIVVLVHEFGHFLAMRAFGYRNVHILALPLVGGVTIGQDVNPGATKRAWMSLMGPLPGIVIGWGLLAIVILGGMSSPWLLPLASTFLFVNYLNVLPVPPLDGAHVVEALLPLRWARVQTVFIGIAAVLGAVVAWQFDLYILVVLALMQLPALRNNWRLHGVERELASSHLPSTLFGEARLRHILRLLDARLGPTPLAANRIRDALQVQQRIDARPMGVPARIATGLVYLFLLAVPVVGIVGYGVFDVGGKRGEPLAVDQDAQLRSLNKQATSLPLSVLLNDISNRNHEPVPAAATPEALARAEARLHHRLPDDLRAFYQSANGLPALGLVAVEKLAAQTPEAMKRIIYGDEKLRFASNSNQRIEINLADAGKWWYLGDDDESPLFYLPEPHKELPGTRVVNYFIESSSAYPTLRNYLEMQWAEQKQIAIFDAKQQVAQRRQVARLANTPVADLLSAWPQPGLVARWIMPEAASSAPASADELAATERRIGLRLPDELRSVLRRQNGFAPVDLLPASRITYWRELSATTDEALLKTWFEGAGAAAGFRDDGGTPIALRSESEIAHCLIVAGRIGNRARKLPTYPRLLWCPNGRPAIWVDPAGHRGYASFRNWLLPQAARMSSIEEMGRE
jgi:Zn-dependent protease/cell wall assembly regulator SMI1